MRYIDKNGTHNEAHSINVLFILECLSNGWTIAHKKCTFQSFNSDQKGYRSQWHNLLNNEQQGRCCYCMKRLNPSNVSIEHIIPRAFTVSKNALEYRQYVQDAPVLGDFVMLADDYKCQLDAGTLNIATEQRMNHLVGLANLLLACPEPKSEMNKEHLDWLGCNCNNARGKKYLLPIMLTPNVDTDIKYSVDGSFYFIDNKKYPESRSGVQFLLHHLNTDSLKEVRHLWYKLSKTSLQDSTMLKTAELKDRIQFFKDAFETDNFEKIEEKYKKYAAIGTDTDLYWRMLLAFDWFLEKYRTQVK